MYEAHLAIPAGIYVTSLHNNGMCAMVVGTKNWSSGMEGYWHDYLCVVMTNMNNSEVRGYSEHIQVANLA